MKRWTVGLALICSAALLSIQGCGGRAVGLSDELEPQDPGGSHHQAVIITRRLIPGGPPIPLGSWVNSHHGPGFIRIGADGVVFHGTPGRIMRHRLPREQLRQLTAAIPAHRPREVQPRYNLAAAIGAPGGVRMELNLPGGSRWEVTVLSFRARGPDAYLEWNGHVPEVVIRISRLLDALEQGGERFVARTVTVGARRDAWECVAKAPLGVGCPPRPLEWPLSLRLEHALLETHSDQGLRIDNPRQAAAVQALVGAGGLADFEQDGTSYDVGLRLHLP